MTETVIVRVDKDRKEVVNSLSRFLQTTTSETLRRCIDFMEIIGNKECRMQDLLDFEKMKKDDIDKDKIFNVPLIDYIKPIEKLREEWNMIHIE